MKYTTFSKFYNEASDDLTKAERVEMFLIEKHSKHPGIRGEYVLGAITHLREALPQSDAETPQLSSGLDKLEERYKVLMERDKNLYLRLMSDFKFNLTTTISLLDRAEKKYLFFRGDFSQGYTYEEYLKDSLFHLEQTAERLHDTDIFPVLSLSIGIVKTNLEKILQRDIEFCMIARSPN